MHVRRRLNLCLISLLPLLGSFEVFRAQGQCAGIATTPAAAADCAARALPQERLAAIDPNHPYTLAELIDFAERNNFGMVVRGKAS
jgi:hypothetical protein